MSPNLDGLRLGISYYLTEADLYSTLTSEFIPGGSGYLEMNLKFKTMVASIEYTWNNLTLAGEYSLNKIDSSSILVGLGPMPDTTSKAMGWYVQANYRLNEKYALGIYYSEFYPDKNDKDGAGQVTAGNPDYYAWQKEIVPTIRVDLSDHFIIKGEVHLVDGAAQAYTYNNPAGREKDWTLYALKATFSF